MLRQTPYFLFDRPDAFSADDKLEGKMNDCWEIRLADPNCTFQLDSA